MPPNTGSAFAGLGPNANDPVQQAIQARQQGGQAPAQLSQVTPAGNQGQPAPVAPDAAQGQIATPQPQKPPDPESTLIVKALNQRLSALSSIEKAGSQPVGGGSNVYK